MSLVYEALKKAQQATATPRGAEGPPTTEAHLDLPTHWPPAADAKLRAIFRVGGEKGPARVVGDGFHGRASDEFQVLTTHLQNFAAEQGKRMVLITSAASSEGKSFVCLNLGISLARSGRRVLLVDADLRTPKLHLPFNTTPLRGLTNFLIDGGDFESCVYATGIPGLELVPAGRSTLAGSEIFASPNMRRFITQVEAADKWSCVLIDSPPALAASETQIISRLVNGLLLVVAANRTSRSAVARTLELLKAAPLLGVVFNRFEPPYSHRVEYGYGYGYGHKARGRESKS
jgi:capsular exopolysaccharide synthesis family protein